jgi:hypothetical protein
MLAVEPFITPVSWLGYRLLHHEDIWFRDYQRPAGSVDGGAAPVKADPWQGNLALPNLLFSRERRDWPRRHPLLHIIRWQKFGLLDFQLAGGFKPWSLVRKPGVYHAVQAIDRMLDPLGALLGFRIFCVVERVANA